MGKSGKNLRLSQPLSVVRDQGPFANLRGGGARDASPGGQNSFNFMQFLGINWPNNSFLHPPLKLALPPPLGGNPGSATEDITRLGDLAKFDKSKVHYKQSNFKLCHGNWLKSFTFLLSVVICVFVFANADKVTFKKLTYK